MLFVPQNLGTSTEGLLLEDDVTSAHSPTALFLTETDLDFELLPSLPTQPLCDKKHIMEIIKYSLSIKTPVAKKKEKKERERQKCPKLSNNPSLFMFSAEESHLK